MGDALAPGLSADMCELCFNVLGSWIPVLKTPCALPRGRNCQRRVDRTLGGRSAHLRGGGKCF